MNSLRWYVAGLLALFGVYVALEYYRPKPLDWSLTLSNKDKIPYGTYATFDVLPTLLGTDSVESVRLPIYDRFYDTEEPEPDSTQTVESVAEPAQTAAADTVADPAPDADQDTADQDTATTDASPAATDSATAEASTDPADTLTQAQLAVTPPDSAATDSTSSTSSDEDEEMDDDMDAAATYRASYLFISPEFSSSEAEAEALRTFVAAGNTVFIAANQFGVSGNGLLRRRRSLLDQLGVRVRSEPVKADLSALTDSVRVRFRNPALAGAAVQLPALFTQEYLVDSARAPGQVLAINPQGHAVYLRLDYGQGHFYLCTVPLAFANYYVLPPHSRRFALAALAYLPPHRPVWWDEYQKQGRTGDQSLLRLLLAHDSLRWAYYLLTITVLALVFTAARRRQRVIPVLNPLPNTTLLFTRTVAGLYRRGSTHGQIAEKKVALFLDYLRSRFQENTPDLADEDFRERLSQKAGVPRARVDELLRYVNYARTAPAVTDRELLVLSRAIQDFKRESS